MRNVARVLTALLIAAAVFLVTGASDAATVTQAASQIAPPAPGLARVWLLRQWDPINMIGQPMVYANGAPLAQSQPGTAYYRDLPPGRYMFTAENCVADAAYGQLVELTPGAQINLEIQVTLTNPPPDCYPPATYYVRHIPPHWADMYFNQLAYLGPR